MMPALVPVNINSYVVHTFDTRSPTEDLYTSTAASDEPPSTVSTRRTKENVDSCSSWSLGIVTARCFAVLACRAEVRNMQR